MSGESMEVIRALFEAQRRRDQAAIERLYHPEIEWDDVSGLWGDWGNRRGIEDVRAAFRTWFEAFGQVEFTAGEMIEAGDRVFCVVRASGQGRESGLSVDQQFFFVWTLSEGRVVRVRVYGDRTEALDVAGLGE